jgi:Secretion system C-terminal sorting domain
MKKIFTLIFFISNTHSFSQTAVTAVSISNSTAITSTTYTIGANIYIWGLSPNNTVVNLNGFTAAGLDYSYASSLNGIVKIRRVNNALVSGNFSLIWSQVPATTSFNMYNEFESDMNVFFDGKTYNKGTDNFFDNTSSNSNNVERLDWILSAGYSTPQPSKIGFLVVERGADNAHDAFCIAAITSLDVNGDPATYGSIKRVATNQFGNIATSTLSYRILKGASGTNLADAGSNSQARGGVSVSLSDLGIAANTTIYGYSLFANDLPTTATPADLVNYNNVTNFPITTGGTPGGIDLIAVTGIYIENSLLPNSFSINANQTNNITTINTIAEQESNIKEYILETSVDGIHFNYAEKQIAQNNAGTNHYTFIYNIANIKTVYFKVKQLHKDGHTEVSKIIQIKNDNLNLTVSVYPNPTSNYLNISFYKEKIANTILEITNSNGSLVRRMYLKSNIGANTISIQDIQEWSKGWYEITIRNEGEKVLTKKFQKL